MTDFVLGIISGVLTTALLWGVGRLWKTTLLPWWQRVVFRGVDVSGRWNWSAKTPAGTPYAAVLTLEQRGHEVSGNLRITTSDESYPSGHIEESSIEGRIDGAVVVLQGNDLDRQRVNPALFMFLLDPGGRSLEGAWTWLSVRQKRISYMDVLARRV